MSLGLLPTEGHIYIPSVATGMDPVILAAARGLDSLYGRTIGFIQLAWRIGLVCLMVRTERQHSDKRKSVATVKAYPSNMLHFATETDNRNHSATFPRAILQSSFLG